VVDIKDVIVRQCVELEKIGIRPSLAVISNDCEQELFDLVYPVHLSGEARRSFKISSAEIDGRIIDFAWIDSKLKFVSVSGNSLI